MTDEVRDIGTAIPLHAGHRERLRERAREAAFKGLPDYELLELFLFRSIPQRDVKPLAKALLGPVRVISARCSPPAKTSFAAFRRRTPRGGCSRSAPKSPST